MMVRRHACGQLFQPWPIVQHHPHNYSWVCWAVNQWSSYHELSHNFLQLKLFFDNDKAVVNLPIQQSFKGFLDACVSVPRTSSCFFSHTTHNLSLVFTVQRRFNLFSFASLSFSAQLSRHLKQCGMMIDRKSKSSPIYKRNFNWNVTWNMTFQYWNWKVWIWKFLEFPNFGWISLKTLKSWKIMK